jgi:hypothetical protein
MAKSALLELALKPPIKPKPNIPETRAVVADAIAHRNIGTLKRLSTDPPNHRQNYWLAFDIL